MPGNLTQDQEDILTVLVMTRITAWGEFGRPRALTLRQAIRVTAHAMTHEINEADIAVALGCTPRTIRNAINRLRPILADVASLAVLMPAELMAPSTVHAHA